MDVGAKSAGLEHADSLPSRNVTSGSDMAKKNKRREKAKTPQTPPLEGLPPCSQDDREVWSLNRRYPSNTLANLFV